MPAEQQIRLDIRRDAVSGGYIWVLQSTNPVTDLARSARAFGGMVEAMTDFQLTCMVLGWTNDITEVPIK